MPIWILYMRIITGPTFENCIWELLQDLHWKVKCVFIGCPIFKQLVKQDFMQKNKLGVKGQMFVYVCEKVITY